MEPTLGLVPFDRVCFLSSIPATRSRRVKEDMLTFESSRINDAWEEFTFHHPREGIVRTSVHMDSITNPAQRLSLARNQMGRELQRLWP